MLKNLRKMFGSDDQVDGAAALRASLAADQAARGGGAHSASEGMITHSVLGQTLVVTIVQEELTTYMAADVNHEIKRLFAGTAGVRNLVLDMENIKYLDSAGLNTFVDLLAVVKGTGGRIGVAAATQQVEVLFKLTRLELVFTIRRSVIETIDAIERVG